MAGTEFKYDVFISYSHKDEKWADKVLRQRLDDAGLKVCIDYRDFEAGKMALLNMQDAAKQSKHVVLILTRNWLNSEWSLFEALVGGTKDPAGFQKKLIPLLCEAGIEKDINEFISMRTWVDFTRKDREEVAWKQLFDTLGKPGNLKPASSNWFFGHRYPDVAAFTGRADELKMLDEWLENKTESLLIINAFGGFGKSALTWHWFNNNVDKATWPTAIWWSFYEKESGFDSFLSDALPHLGIETKERSSRQQVNDLLDAMQKTNILIVLDGFERLLRQYGRMDAALQEDEEKEVDPSQRDCTSQPAETFLRGLSDKQIVSKVLMTSRLFPRALEGRDGKLQSGCREVELKGFSPDDAVKYFHNEGIAAATRAEIIELSSAYGYHPLSLTLLVGWINREDGNEHRGDIVEAKNLNIFDNIKARRDHVLERAYESLAPERRDLLSKISCFRGSMEYAVLKKVFPSPDLDKALLDLRKRGLLQYAGDSQRYDMHPIVRHYAYDKFAAPNKTDAHTCLVNYFEAVPKPQKVNTLEDLAPVIELYHHMVRAGNLDEGLKLFYDRINKPAYYQFGAYQLQIELLRALFLDGEDKPSRLKDEAWQAWTLNELANSYSTSGQPSFAVPMFETYIKMHEYGVSHPEPYTVNEWKRDLAIGLGNVATMAQIQIGSLNAAERNLRRGIELCNEVSTAAYITASKYRDFGEVLNYCGNWKDAEHNLSEADDIFKKDNHVQGQSTVWSNRALRFLLLARANPQSQIENLKSAIECTQRALELADETAKIQFPYPRDYVRGYWLLGSAYRAVSINSNTDELTLAEENLSKALNLCRQINAVEAEADILLDVARLHYAQGDFKDALEKASEALVITERCGYVLQGADVNLFLAQFALEQEKDKAKAKQYAETALKLATCDGPPYYYKVAYEEAERMLEKLK